jgi:hypothetical protein
VKAGAEMLLTVRVTLVLLVVPTLFVATQV